MLLSEILLCVCRTACAKRIGAIVPRCRADVFLMETSLSVIEMLKEGEDAARQQARDPTRALLDEHRLIAVLCEHDSTSFCQFLAVKPS